MSYWEVFSDEGMVQLIKRNKTSKDVNAKMKTPMMMIRMYRLKPVDQPTEVSDPEIFKTTYGQDTVPVPKNSSALSAKSAGDILNTGNTKG